MSEQDQIAGFIGLWIIEKESGIPLTSLEMTQKSKIDSVLFSGFLVAIQGFINDFEIGQLNSFSTDISQLLITGSNEVLSVLAIQKNINVDYWYPTLIRIQKVAENFYKAITENKKILLVDTAVFDELKPKFREIILTSIDNIVQTSKGQNLKQSIKEKKAQDKLKDSGLW